MLKRLSFGKACEYRVFSELLAEELEVFLPAVDNRGVDCLIKNQKGHYIEIQIKGRQPRDIFNIHPFIPRDNYYFVLIPPDKKTYVVPSLTVYKWLNGKPKFYLSKTLRTEFESNYSLLKQ